MKWRRILPAMGQALLLSVSYLHPGHWAVDIEAGAGFRYTLLWVLLASTLLAILIQSLSARLGIASGQSLPEICRERFSRPVVWVLWAAAEASVLAGDLARFVGAALGFNMLLGIPLIEAAVLTGMVALGLLALERSGHHAAEYAIITLVAVIGLAYVYEVLLARPGLGGIARGLLIPNIRGGRLFLGAGLLGATAMPANIYLDSVLVQERQPSMEGRERIRSRIMNSSIALSLAFLVNAAILVMSAVTFYNRGSIVTSMEQAHQTLDPLLGGASAVGFAIALLASGLGSSTTAAHAGQVILQGFLGVRTSLLPRRLLVMVPALIVIYLRVDSLKVLVLSQACLSFALPFAIIPLIRLTADGEVMGEFVNRKATTMLAWVGAAGILILDALLVYRMLD